MRVRRSLRRYLCIAVALLCASLSRLPAAVLDGAAVLDRAAPEAVELRRRVHQWPGAAGRDQLMQLAKGSRFILLGEATHGTSEFYRDRAEMTRRLIEDQNVRMIAFEADWPSMGRVDRYVRGQGAPIRSTMRPITSFRRTGRSSSGRTTAIKAMHGRPALVTQDSGTSAI